MQPSLDRGLKIIALPIAEEASDAPSDTGSEVELLMAEFPEKVEFGRLQELTASFDINLQRHVVRLTGSRSRGAWMVGPRR